MIETDHQRVAAIIRSELPDMPADVGEALALWLYDGRRDDGETAARLAELLRDIGRSGLAAEVEDVL